MNLGRAEKKFPTEEVMGNTPTCWASLQVHIIVTAILDLQSGLWLVVNLWDIVFKGQTLQTLQDTNFPFVVKKNLPIRVHHLSAVSGHSSYMWIMLFLFNRLQCSLSQSIWSVDLKHLRSPPPHPSLCVAKIHIPWPHPRPAESESGGSRWCPGICKVSQILQVILTHTQV